MKNSGDRGDTGLQGPAGERGPKGDHGQHGDRGTTGAPGAKGDHGQHGDRGTTGAPGAKGEPGLSSILTRNVTLSFWIVVLVAFAVTAALGYNVKKNREQIMDNQQLRQRIDRNQAVGIYNLCVAVNEQRDVLADVYRSVLKQSGGNGVGDSARRQALVRLQPTKCPPAPVKIPVKK